jgi:hypothetical protein
MFCRQFGSMDHELIRVEYNLFGALFDLESNLDAPLIAPFPTKLKIVDGDCIVRWFDAVI